MWHFIEREEWASVIVREKNGCTVESEAFSYPCKMFVVEKQRHENLMNIWIFLQPCVRFSRNFAENQKFQKKKSNKRETWGERTFFFHFFHSLDSKHDRSIMVKMQNFDEFKKLFMRWCMANVFTDTQSLFYFFVVFIASLWRIVVITVLVCS